MVREGYDEPQLEEEEIEEEIEEEVRRTGKAKAKARGKKKKRPAGPKGGEAPQPSAIFYLHSLFLFGGRILKKMLDFYNSLFDLSPGDKAKVYRNISAHYAAKGLHEKALDYLKEWTRLEPSNQDAYYQLGIALVSSGNSKSAIGAFDKVLKLKPNHKGAMYRKSRLYVKLKDYKSGIEGLEELLKLDPENPNPNAYYLLGIAYDRSDEIEKALKALQKAVELDPQEIRYRQYLGFLYERKGDHEQAAKSFSKVMELEREQEEEDY